MAHRSRARSPEARDDQQILPEAEMEILAILEARREADAREIREALAGWRPMSHASVLTLLGRLESKNLVERRKGNVGKAYIYTATRQSRPFHRQLVRRVLRRIFANDPASLVATLFDAKAPTEEELRQIRAMVDQLEEKRRG